MYVYLQLKRKKNYVFSKIYSNFVPIWRKFSKIGRLKSKPTALCDNIFMIGFCDFSQKSNILWSKKQKSKILWSKKCGLFSKFTSIDRNYKNTTIFQFLFFDIRKIIFLKINTYKKKHLLVHNMKVFADQNPNLKKKNADFGLALCWESKFFYELKKQKIK